MEKSRLGRPPRYESVGEMKELIEAYFKECDGVPYRDEDGNVLTDKYGNPIFTKQRPYTITGLALALGFTTRQGLLNYEGKEEFVDTIKEAKAKVEQYAEERLYDRDGVNGAKFSLANNFKNWSEKQQIEASVDSTMNINIELSDD